MPNLTGLFDYFPGLDLVSAEKVIARLKLHKDPKILENQFGNRILYPQTVPVTAEDLLFDFAILQEVLKLQPDKFFNNSLKRIMIPEIFLDRFPDINKLTWAFIDALEPVGLVTIFLKLSTVGTKNLGSLIKPVIAGNGLINLSVSDKKYQINVGSVVVIPGEGNHLSFQFESAVSTLNGRGSFVAQVTGGPLGIIVDARKQTG